MSTDKILIRELHHRIKNHLQFVVSLYRLKLKKYLNHDGKIMLEEAEHNIRSIGKIHEILYASNNASTIDANKYFLELVDELKKGYATNNIQINIDANIELDSEVAISCGLILNELVTNSIKYAFGTKKGIINITLHELLGNKVFTISDNGIGYNNNTQKKFGLSFVERLTVSKLNGTIEIDTQNGTVNTISW
jgi:two-component sensor histidine kinase